MIAGQPDSNAPTMPTAQCIGLVDHPEHLIQRSGSPVRCPGLTTPAGNQRHAHEAIQKIAHILVDDEDWSMDTLDGIVAQLVHHGFLDSKANDYGFAQHGPRSERCQVHALRRCTICQ